MVVPLVAIGMVRVLVLPLPQRIHGLAWVALSVEMVGAGLVIAVVWTLMVNGPRGLRWSLRRRSQPTL